MRDMKSRIIRTNVDNNNHKLSLIFRFVAILLQSLLLTQLTQSSAEPSESSLGVLSNREALKPLIRSFSAHKPNAVIPSLLTQFVSQALPLSQSLSLSTIATATGHSIPDPIAEPLDSHSISNSSAISMGMIYESVANGCAQIAVHSFCSCYALAEGLLIDCNITAIYQMRDVLNSLISQPIKSFSVHSINQSLHSLPQRLFQNFSAIEQIYISLPSLVNVSFGAFRGLDTSLKSLSLVNSKLESIPKQALNNLKSLETLDLESNDIREVESNAFYGLPLVSLNLQSNKINDLLELSFGGLENTLTELVLIGNRLESFPLPALRRLQRLETLKLQSNQIVSIADDGMTRFHVLRSLDLHSNRMSRLEAQTFKIVPKLVSLSVANNKLTALSDSSAFEALYDLETLDLSHNQIRAVNLNNLIALRSLDISHNHLQDIQFHNLPNLKEVFVSHNHILKLTNESFLNSTSLSVIFLQHNAIEAIDYKAFHSLVNLLTLDLSSNQLKAIDSQLFRHSTRLQSLYLDNNLISDSGLEAQTLRELQALEHLDLSFNRLTRTHWLAYLGKSVRYVSVRHNFINSIADNAFENMSSIETIDLRQNFLTQLSHTLFATIEPNLQSILLSGNPFHCDCRLLSIYEWLQKHSRLLALTDREGMICAQPERLKDKALMSLDTVDFCPVPLISLIEISKLQSTQVRIRWEVQNETVVKGFTLEYYLTDNRTPPPLTHKFLGPFERQSDITDLRPENWYTVCVEANGKYMKSEANIKNKPTPNVMDEHKSLSAEEYVTSDRKCSQVRTLSPSQRTLISLPTLYIIVSAVVFVVLTLTLCVLFAAYKYRFERIRPTLKSEVPEEYITYRHFSLPSSENVYS